VSSKPTHREARDYRVWESVHNQEFGPAQRIMKRPARRKPSTPSKRIYLAGRYMSEKAYKRRSRKKASRDYDSAIRSYLRTGKRK
jgi:hypothetical protein